VQPLTPLRCVRGSDLTPNDVHMLSHANNADRDPGKGKENG